ncbi:DUF6328 family protein [Tessaracoccus sp. Y36]|uniref:DUF6328 family protein n=1 Tax=Tessaracoccus sp. ZS01 TaxID=1906324 RepID=UPI00096DE0BB|nr:DUF6328 family protein [Tessaracoccus sp. ZS01]MCG6567475.1 hypothetical protein [Tessaracoccus sp. ZS01]OMG57038.1 hypothetical protein BJN44_07570 [Tessaracoccus sp. ZS01]
MANEQPRPDDIGRDQEPPHKRLDRHWNELLQELRVTQGGVQILAGLLYTLPFQARFEAVDQAQRWVYLGAVSFATLSAALLIAPVAFHRALFRRRLRQNLIRVSATVTKLGLALLALSLTLVSVLVFSVVAGWVAAAVSGGVAVLFFSVVWLALPLGWSRGSPEKEGEPKV